MGLIDASGSMAWVKIIRLVKSQSEGLEKEVLCMQADFGSKSFSEDYNVEDLNWLQKSRISRRRSC